MRSPWHGIRALALAVVLCPAICSAGERCVSCHPAQVRSYLETGMGRSVSRLALQPRGTYNHALSGARFAIRGQDGAMLQRAERNGVAVEHPVAWVVGSGNAAFAYLVRSGPYLFQSPFSFYAPQRTWGLAPGYEHQDPPDFNRPVTEECLWCHSGSPAPIPGTVNRFEERLFEAEAISCDRCHGPVEAHLAKPSRQTIVNPARLEGRARDSVCEQCHLSGEIRILNPGHGFGDFRPGMPLEETLSVYLEERPGEAAGGHTVKVISHVEQLAQSRCLERSQGRLWCGTCHNPHDKPADAVTYYSERCMSCHDRQSLVSHRVPLTGCVACHMPRKPARDGGHSAFTDHRIARVHRPGPESPQPADPALRAWKEPAGPLAPRNLGLAYFELGRRNRSAVYLDRSYRLLAGALDDYPDDPDIKAVLGSMMVLKGVAEPGVRMLQSAVDKDPARYGFYLSLAQAWRAADQPGKAAEVLREAIRLEAGLDAAYWQLDELLAQTGQTADRIRLWQEHQRAVGPRLAAQEHLRSLKADASTGR